jgi:hypothetical protein
MNEGSVHGQSKQIVWVVYGLLENRTADHDLRFIEETTTPQRTADEHPEYEACVAFPRESLCQLEPGSKVIANPVVAFMPGVRWPNAAERAGR